MHPRASGGGITLKSPRELDLMRQAGHIVYTALKRAKKLVKPGVTTEWVDRQVEEIILDMGGKPAFKGYKGFPAATCSSVNEEVVHGIPGKRCLTEGDVLKLDVGVEVKHYFADSAWSFPVGSVSALAKNLLKTCEEALWAGVAQARAGNRLRDISAAVEGRVRKSGFSVVEQYVGHGIGWKLHEPPQIPNYVRGDFEDLDLVLRPGMVLAIEPMVNAGGVDVETLADGWTVVTKDRQLSAHFEHTVCVTDGNPQVLTETPDEAGKRKKS